MAGQTRSGGPAAAKSCGCCAPIGADLDLVAGEDGAAACDVVEGVQAGRVAVKGGYSPATIRLAKGIPARLVFKRQETSRCSEELLIPAFGVRRALPTGEETVIEFTPRETGTFAFTCGMRMLRGEIVVS